MKIADQGRMVKFNTLYVSLRAVVLAAMMAVMGLMAMAPSAEAQALPADYSAAHKTLYIELARAGDADALYQLGLMHFHGLGASQNDKVARSFFTHASAKGHGQARQILATMAPVIVTKPKVETKPNIKPNSAYIQLNKKPVVAGSEKTDRQKALQAKRKAAKAERQAKRQAAKAERDAARAAKQAANKARRQAMVKARQAAALKKSTGSTRLLKEDTDTQEKAVTIPAPKPDKKIIPQEPHSQMTSNKSKGSSEIAAPEPAVQKAGFGALLKGLLTAVLLLTMFVAMVLMGRRMRG